MIQTEIRFLGANFSIYQLDGQMDLEHNSPVYLTGGVRCDHSCGEIRQIGYFIPVTFVDGVKVFRSRGSDPTVFEVKPNKELIIHVQENIWDQVKVDSAIGCSHGKCERYLVLGIGQNQFIEVPIR